MKDTVLLMMRLLRFTINPNIDIGISEEIDVTTLEKLFAISKKHDIAHLLGDTLDKNGLLPDNAEISKRFLRERDLAVYRYRQIQYEYARICDTLSKASIPHIPLKGSVLRDYYPAPWMRTSCDIDIMIKPDDLERTISILESNLGYQYDSTGENDANLHSKSGVHLELRYNHSSVNTKSKDVLDGIWESVKDNTVYKRAVSDEMFYFYHIHHMAGHFAVGGCGVRFFLDLWIMNQRFKLDEQEKNRLLCNAGISEFAYAIEKTVEYWFADGESNELIEEIERYVFRSGIYGNVENRVAVQTVKQGGKLKYLLQRIFLPYDQLKFLYPTLQKRPMLYPFYVVKRWFRIFDRDTKRRAMLELNETTRGDAEKQARVAELFKELNI